MKILMLSTDTALFDADSPVRARLIDQSTLAKELHVVVETPKGDQYVDGKFEGTLFLHPTSSPSKLARLSDAYRIGKKILSENDPGDWLITAQDPFLCGAIGYLLSRKYSIPLHLQFHTDPWSDAWKGERLRNRVEFLIMRFLLSRAAGLRVVSERVRRSVLAVGYPASEVTTVPIFVDVAKYRDGVPQFDLHKSYPAFSRIILSIGRLQPEKNYARLVKAFAAVHRVHDDAMLLIVGSGPEREHLSSLVRTLDIEKAVVLLPWARDVVSYYKSSDLYVQPSRYEGWGMAIIEAMASGLPVVMTDVGCAGEVVKNEETGLVVPPDDEKALALAMMRLLEDTQLRVTLASAGKEEVAKLATKEETLELYRRSWRRAYGKDDPEPEPKTKHTHERKKEKSPRPVHAAKKKRASKRA